MTTRRTTSHFLVSCRRSARPLGATAIPILLSFALVALFGACDPAISLDEIRSLQAQGRYADTIEPLRKHLEATPDDPQSHLLYGTALARTGRERVAVWSLRKAAEDPALHVPATLELSGAQARAANWTAAIEAAEQVLEIEPENLPAHILRGEAYLGEGKQPERALEDFDFVLDQDPTSHPALAARASALLMAGRIDEAAETIDRLEVVVRKNPADEVGQAELCAVQSVLRQERREVDEAKKRFEECLEQFPAYAVVVDPAIGFFDALGDHERSDRILEKALELAPQSVSYRRTLALRAEAAGDSKRALSILVKGLETEDRELRTAVYTDLANYHLDRDELPEAIAAFEQALALVDDPPQLAILTHADLLARAGRHADALRVAKGLGNDAFVGLIEARVALDEGDPKRALARLDQVFPLWPNNAGARYYAARAAEQTGDFARAIEEYRQSIRSAPDQTEAALRLAKLYLAGGALEDAWTSAWQYFDAHDDDPEVARVIVAASARDDRTSLHEVFSRFRGTPLWAAAVAARAHFVADKQGAGAALEWIEKLPGKPPNWTLPLNAELLRERVLLLETAGRRGEAEKAIAAALDAHPESSAFREIRGAWLEATGAAPTAVRAAYASAVEANAKDWLALEGLGRSFEAAGETQAALEAFDRSRAVHPESARAARQAALLAARSGDSAGAEKRWRDLLKEHPWDAEAARVIAEIQTAQGQNDETTLDLAERAVMFGGGKEAESLLIQIHEARGETKRAHEIAQAFAEGKPIPPRNQKAAVANPASPPASPDPIRPAEKG